jgi:hypothetical protein
MNNSQRINLKLQYSSDRFFSGDDRGLRWFYNWYFLLDPVQGLGMTYHDFYQSCLHLRNENPKMRHQSMVSFLRLKKLYISRQKTNYSLLLL